MRLPTEQPISELLNQVYGSILDTFALRDPQKVLFDEESLFRILHATFDTSTRAFVLAESSSVLLPHLDGPCPVIIFTQAIAGIILFLRRVEETVAPSDRGAPDGTHLSAGVFARELQLMAESDARRRTLDILDREGSALFGACFMRSQVDRLIWKAIEDRDDGMVELPMAGIGEELLHKGVAWVSDRPCRNMGLPSGFTIIALN